MKFSSQSLRPPTHETRTRRGFHAFIGLLGVAVAILSASYDPASADTSASPGADWEGYNNSLDGQRFSPLKQLTPESVNSLQEICRAPVADDGTFESGLVMVDGTLYATTATDTVALDPTNCSVKWRNVYARSWRSSLPINRGVAVMNGRVFRGTDDGRLIALNAADGKQVWKSTVGDPKMGEMITGAPAAWNGLVFVGTATSEAGVRGKIAAYDALTGREVWTFRTVPVGKEIGADTWKNKQWAEHGGGASWSTITVDAATGEIFIPVGNPVPDWAPSDRPGANLFTDSVVVLDGLSGKLLWWYQLLANDSGDRDLGAAPVLYRTSKNQAVVSAGSKDGYLYRIDRVSHTLINKTAVTTVDKVPMRPTPLGVKVCPGVVGGVEWNGPSFDPVLGLLIVGAVDYCSILRSAPGTPWVPNGNNLGGTWSPTDQPALGWITAVDADSGRVRWKYHAASPVVAGVTSTAGGVILSGDSGGNFLILRSSDGMLLRSIETGGALAGGVITYEQGSKQYVAFTAGNFSRTTFGVLGRPTVIVMGLTASTASNQTAGSDIARGAEVFFLKCAACHGADGKNVANHDLSSIGTRMSAHELKDWLKNPAPPMPKVFPEPLGEQEANDLDNLIAYLLASR